MKNKAPFLVLVGAVIFGLLASVSVSSYLAKTRSNNKLNTIVVAKMEIPLGSKILSEQLTTVQVPIGATPEGAFTDEAKVVGRITITRIAAREAVIKERLAIEGSVAGLSAIIPEGLRAMTVKVEDDSGMSGFVLPGTIVDVATVLKISNNSFENTVSKIILQNIKVLANGDNLDEPEDKRDAQKARTVTLLVTPEQAEKLLLASVDNGHLRLVMRNAADLNADATRGASVRTLLTGEEGLSAADFAAASMRPKVPAAAPATVRRVTRPQPRSATVAEILAPLPAPQAPPPRAEIQVFEGMKKRSVEFPEH